MIINRYLQREIIFTMLTVTTITVFIFICNRFVHYLGYVASGQYAFHILLYLVMLQIPVLFGLLLPLGLFLGILLTYGRLYADSEMTVLTASGFSPRQLSVVTFKVALLVAVVVAMLVMWLNPRILRDRDKLLDFAKTSTMVDTIMPGQFKRSEDGTKVIYIKRMSRSRQHLHDIFIAQQLPHVKGAHNQAQLTGWSVLSARSGEQKTDPTTKEDFMMTMDGYRYKGIPGQKIFQVIQFKTYGVRLSQPHATGQSVGEEVTSTSQLFDDALHQQSDMAELQWRVSMPISVFILAFLALPLSYVKPRHGRFAQLLPAILLYILYANMMFVSRGWLEDGSISSWLGLWWVHVMMLGVGGLLYLKPILGKR